MTLDGRGVARGCSLADHWYAETCFHGGGLTCFSPGRGFPHLTGQAQSVSRGRGELLDRQVQRAWECTFGKLGKDSPVAPPTIIRCCRFNDTITNISGVPLRYIAPSIYSQATARYGATIPLQQTLHHVQSQSLRCPPILESVSLPCPVPSAANQYVWKSVRSTISANQYTKIVTPNNSKKRL
jgi:hypothetical protein